MNAVQLVQCANTSIVVNKDYRGCYDGLIFSKMFGKESQSSSCAPQKTPKSTTPPLSTTNRGLRLRRFSSGVKRTSLPLAVGDIDFGKSTLLRKRVLEGENGSLLSVCALFLRLAETPQ